MDIRQLNYFIVLADKLNLIEAADQLFITPQALSKSMRILAAELNHDLFVRHQNKLQLTPFGKLLYKEATDIVERFNAMKKRIDAAACETIKLAFAHGIMQNDVQEFIQKFIKDHPTIQLQYTEMPDVFCDQGVSSGIFDLGIGIMPFDPTFELEATLLQKNKICAIVREDHPLAKKKQTTLQECSNYPIITKNEIFKVHDIIENHAIKQHINLHYSLTSSNEILWQQMVEQNQGVGIGVSYYKVLTNHLAATPFAEDELAWNIAWIKAKSHHLTIAQKSFIQELEKFWQSKR